MKKPTQKDILTTKLYELILLIHSLFKSSNKNVEHSRAIERFTKVMSLTIESLEKIYYKHVLYSKIQREISHN